MALEIIEEKSPLGRAPPPVALAFTIEVDRKRSDQVKFSTQIGQRLAGTNGPDSALDLQEIQQFGEKRIDVDIEAQTAVPQLLEDEKEKTASATQVENRLGRATVHLQILRSDDVQAQPSGNVSVFRVVLAGAGMTRLEIGQSSLVDLGQETPKRQGMNKTLRPSPRTPIGERLRELRNFVRESHPNGGVAGSAHNDPARKLT